MSVNCPACRTGEHEGCFIITGDTGTEVEFCDCWSDGHVVERASSFS